MRRAFAFALIVSSTFSMSVAADNFDDFTQALQKRIGDHIQDQLHVKKIKQAQIADQIGVSRSRFSKIATGLQLPTLGQAYLIARTLDIDIDWLMDVSSVLKEFVDRENLESLFRHRNMTASYSLFKSILQLGSLRLASENVSPEKRSICETDLSGIASEDLMRTLERRGWDLSRIKLK